MSWRGRWMYWRVINICPEIFRDGYRHLTITMCSKFRGISKVDGLMDIYAVNDPFIQHLKKRYSCGIIQSDLAPPPLACSPACQTEVFCDTFPALVLKLMPDPPRGGMGKPSQLTTPIRPSISRLPNHEVAPVTIMFILYFIAFIDR